MSDIAHVYIIPVRRLKLLLKIRKSCIASEAHRYYKGCFTNMKAFLDHFSFHYLRQKHRCTTSPTRISRCSVQI